MAQKDESVTPSLVDIWKKVISTFTDVDGDFPLSNQISKMEANDTAVYVIDYSDLSQKATNLQREEDQLDYHILTKAIVERPESSRESCKGAVFKMLKSRNETYAEHVEKDFRVAFKNTPIPKIIGEITHTDLYKSANMRGIVTEVQDPLLYNKTMVFRCERGHPIEVDAEGIRITKPDRCDVEDCGSRKLRADAELSEVDTFQQIKIQRKLTGDSSTKIPRELTIMMFGREISDTANPGDYIVCDGVIKSMELKGNMTALATFYLDAYSIQVQKEEFVETDPNLDDKVKGAVRKGHEKEDFLKLVESIAPSIKGSDAIKMNLLLMLTGSDPRWLPGKKRHRGEIQMLLVGDAATAKTSFAEFIIQCFNRGVWASGVKGASTAVGLRASVFYDSSTGTGKLSAGAYLMASTKYGGLVVIDEVADMPPEDYRSMLEATDDKQTLTIRKSQISKEIQVNCASMHMCNPKTAGRRWDDTKNIHENTGLDTPMLTRYDTIWVLRDIMDEKRDGEVADHMVDMVSAGMTDEEYQKSRGRFDGAPSTYTPQFLQAWAQYVRKTFHPRIEEGTKASDKLRKFYMTMRKSARMYNEQQTEMAKVISKITPRELTNLFRLAEASARAHHRDVVTPEDAEIAISLLQESLSSSGFNPLTGEWKPVTIMKVQEEKEEESKVETRAERVWARRGTIMYEFIKGLSLKTCVTCRGKKWVNEKSMITGNSERIDCDTCGAKGVYADVFKTEDLINLMVDKGMMRHRVIKFIAEIDGSSPGGSQILDGRLNNVGILRVGDWVALESWCSRW